MNNSTRAAGRTVNKRKMLAVINRLEKHLGMPERRNDKHPPDPLDMLIATLLSQNTNDTNSYRAWTKLKEKYPDYESMYRARTSSIESAIRSGGMAKQKATRIKELLRSIRKKYGSFSLSRLRRKSDIEILEELTSLNGIGMKTASCVLLFSLGRKSFPVDTHVHRILNRIGIVTTPNPEKTFLAVQELIPPEKMYSFHTNLIRFGRSTCKAQQPECYDCPFMKLCQYGQKVLVRNGKPKNKQAGNKKRDFMLLDNVRL